MTEIRRAAMRQRAAQSTDTFALPSRSGPIQPGYSIDALRNTAVELIAEAQLKLDIRAYLSAEEKAKKALEIIAQSIDTREQSAVATRDLTIALTAIREAEDFVGKYGLVDGATITRMVRSHSTEVLKPYDTSNLNGLAAADVYLDWSRKCITPLVVADPLAADAIRILAQSHRLRDDGTPFGIATSVHLIRAAAEGAPTNQQVQVDYETTLKIAGLSGAYSVEHDRNVVRSNYVDPMVSLASTSANAYQNRSTPPGNSWQGQQKRDIQVLEVSPEQFAAISPTTSGPSGTPHAQMIPGNSHYNTQPNQPSNTQNIPYRPDHVNQAVVNQASPNSMAPVQPTDSSVKGRLSKAFNPITRLLR
jgi:hypothetical protein